MRPHGLTEKNISAELTRIYGKRSVRMSDVSLNEIRACKHAISFMKLQTIKDYLRLCWTSCILLKVCSMNVRC